MALYETEACQSAVLAAVLTGSNLPWSEAKIIMYANKKFW